MKTMIRAFALAATIACSPIAIGAQAQAQATFASPDEAVAALVKAARAADRKALLAVLGADAASFVPSGDRVADRSQLTNFLGAYDKRNAIAAEGDKATLSIGEDNYPFAFPLVKRGDRWQFDTAAGKDEMLARRVGQNELAAIDVLRAVTDAQFEYASEDRNGNGTLEYARRFASSPGKRDGLYWPVKSGQPPSPLGALVASAADDGYEKSAQRRPFHGYYFKPLRGQGPDAQRGAVDYIVKGRAIGGFAVVAWPAKYGNSGVMSFIVNHDGDVYEKDLGPNTQAIASAMRRFNPDKTWTKVPTR